MKKIENDVARSFCTKANLPVAKRVADELLDAAMTAKDTKRVRELSALVDDIESAIVEASEAAKPAPPAAQPNAAKK